MKLEIVSTKPKGISRAVPILFVHGAWHGAWCWEKNFMPYFAENGYTTYALSLRGHGDSEGPKRFRWMRISDYSGARVRSCNHAFAYFQDLTPFLISVCCCIQYFLSSAF